MKKRPSRLLMALLSGLTLGIGPIWAQTVAPSSQPNAAANDSHPQSTAAEDESTIILDPFTVTTEHEGYQAVDTLGGGRIRTKLADTPSSLSVVTKKLMQDLGVTNAQSLLVYTNNTEVAGLGGNFSGTTSRGTGSNGEGALLSAPQNQTRARGIAALDNTRNYFLTDIPWDGYNISRLDITRGPNSFLFGFGSPSGIANVQTNEATFSDKGSVEARYGSFGSTRESLDYNKILIPSVLAVRLDLVNDNQVYEQKPAYNHSKRAYGALRFDPKLFDSDSTHTKIQANFEHGNVKSNNPRTIPPTDYITDYLNDPMASPTGYDPFTLKGDGSNSHPQISPYASNGSLANQFQWSNSMTYFWNPDGSLQKAGQAEWSAPTGANYGLGAAGFNNQYFVHSQGYSAGAYAANYAWRVKNGGDVAAVDGADTPFKGAYFGTVPYLDKTLSDPTIFDYIHKLIDGNNKHEWQNWNAFNVSVTETLFHDRLALQAILDHQDFKSGYENWLDNTVIALDLSNTLLAGGYPSWTGKGSANPNLGRPALYGGQGSGHNQESTRNSYQATAAYNLDFERDFGMKGAAASILGHHDFTALFGSYRQTTHSEDYRLAGVDHAWNVAYNGSTASKITDNGYDWTAYLGPSLLGTKGSGANLPNLSFSNAPIQTNVFGYNKTWTGTVSPTAAWNVTIPSYLQPDGTMSAPQNVALTQADNPANYVGYAQTQMTTLLNPKANMDLLRNASSLNDQKITSEAVMYQGHFWDDTIIPSVGYRRDKTQQRGNIGIVDSVTGMVSDVPRIDDPGVSATTNSTSYGVAVHLPKAIKKNLPEGTDVSLYYFHGNNETPKVRYGIDGAELPNEKGKTDDYSIQVDALNGRATLRLTYFKTLDTTAPASYGQPLGNGVGWLIQALPSWTLSMAAYGIEAAQIGSAGMNALGEGGNNWFWQWGVDHPAAALSIAPVLQGEFLDAYPESWWRSHQTNVNVAAIKAGDWMHVADGTNSPLPWNIYGTGTIHGQYPIIDQDVEAKGFELEATFRPLKNWDVTFNGSRATAEQTALGEHTIKQLDAMSHLWLDTPLGQTAEWGSYTTYGTMKRQFITTLYGPYLTQRALTGTQQPEWSKLKFNIISNYRFDRGVIKGFNIGGAYRWEDKRIIGYGISQQEIFGTPTWLSDVNKPLWSPTESHFDMWVGYSHKLTAKLDWRIQLNVSNVGEKVHLVAIAMEPDGSVAQSRIANGQQYNLTSTISF